MRRLLSLTILALFAHSFAAEITILPIDRAQMLAGASFDFRVEVADYAGSAEEIEVLVNGIPAADFFGAELVADTEGGAQNLMIRDVHIARPGSYTVSVRVQDDGGVSRAAVTYQVIEVETLANPARNVILFISDGMTLNQLAAARVISQGQQQGRFNSLLAIEQADAFALVTTSGMDSIITDSANSAAAYNTGHKSVVNALGAYPANLDNPNEHPRVELLGEIVRRTTGMSIGVVTNTHITDATPASVYAHTRRRSEHQFIADTFLDGLVRPEVFLGGGSRWFLPASVPGSLRGDERDLITEAEALGYEFVTTAAELAAATAPDGRLLGFFHLNDFNSYLDREYFQNPEVLGDFDDQPLLWDQVQAAIDVLSRNPEGFLLIVESGNNDKFLHPLDWHRATWDVLELDRTVALAREWAIANGDDTLIIVTADHGHGFSTYGTYDATQGAGVRDAVRVYEQAGFPTYGDRLDRNGLPVPDTDVILAVGIANHPDYCETYVVTERHLAPASNSEAGYVAADGRCELGGTLMQGNLPLPASTGVHTLDDVPLYASGPGSDYFFGVTDNTEVFFAIARALQLDATLGR